MKPPRRLLDSTLRDGEQSPGVSFTAQQKLEIAALLDGAGVYQIEAGTPASSKREKEIIAKIVGNRKNSLVSAWARLVLSDIEHAIDVAPDFVHVSVPVSYVHIYAKLRKNKNWVIGQLYACLGLAEKRGARLSVGFEDAFRSEPSFLITVSRILLDFGVTRIRLSDTVGTATPTLCRTAVRDLNDAFGGKAELGFHGHNDLGMATANTLEAMKSGCMYADVTLRGIGERAGNCDLSELVRAASPSFDLGIKPEAARELTRRFDEILGKAGEPNDE
ncbi:MAG: homocitrate synthase [Oscillospiraceae bacterium]|jgi:homocitrate synthase NifV|nr:homocitrate synthase [Oscillospiraceae bacterium]